jgi:hypothetical protein
MQNTLLARKRGVRRTSRKRPRPQLPEAVGVSENTPVATLIHSSRSELGDERLCLRLVACTNQNASFSFFSAFPMFVPSLSW